MRFLPLLVLLIPLAACAGTPAVGSVAENPAFPGCVQSVAAAQAQVDGREDGRAAELAACLERRA